MKTSIGASLLATTSREPSLYDAPRIYAVPCDEHLATPTEKWTMTTVDGVRRGRLPEDLRIAFWHKLYDPVTGEQWAKLREVYQKEGLRVRWFDHDGNFCEYFPPRSCDVHYQMVECSTFAKKVHGFIAIMRYLHKTQKRYYTFRNPLDERQQRASYARSSGKYIDYNNDQYELVWYRDSMPAKRAIAW